VEESYEDQIRETYDFFCNCLYIREIQACVISDLHIGLEDELYYQGLQFPLDEEQHIMERLRCIIDRFSPSLFILNGDIIHSFSLVTRNVKRKLDSVLTMLKKHSQVILLSGSHDVLLASLPVHTEGRFDCGGFTVMHGDTAVQDHGALVVGHEHPVIEIEMERMACFLFGEKAVHGRDMIILPAFHPFCQGVLINRLQNRDLLSPYRTKMDFSAFHPILEVEGEVLIFPRLFEMRRSRMTQLSRW
jgi:uncharacterized protein